MEGNVVETIYSDGATVYICDDYCRDKTPEDVDKILKSIVEQFTEYLQVQNSPEGRAERMARQGRVRRKRGKSLLKRRGTSGISMWQQFPRKRNAPLQKCRKPSTIFKHRRSRRSSGSAISKGKRWERQRTGGRASSVKDAADSGCGEERQCLRR